MTMLEWDQPGSHVYQRGVDRGVLYLSDGTAVPWNGLTGVDETKTDSESTSYHYDGVKYLEHRQPGDFQAKLRAITYPEEFELYEGYGVTENGFLLDNQPIRNYFGLSYRTLVGNELEGDSFAYRLHILYNLTATPDAKGYKTLSGDIELSEFAWNLTGVPVNLPGYRPTMHLILDTRRVNPYIILDVEEMLYGNDFDAPYLPTLLEIHNFVENWVPLIVTDNGDGTFTVTGSDEDIVKLNETTYSIEDSSTTNRNPNSYQISSQI